MCMVMHDCIHDTHMNAYAYVYHDTHMNTHAYITYVFICIQMCIAYAYVFNVYRDAIMCVKCLFYLCEVSVLFVSCIHMCVVMQSCM